MISSRHDAGSCRGSWRCNRFSKSSVFI
jgi:hypothetical protein